MQNADKIGAVSIRTFYSTNEAGFMGWGYEVSVPGFVLYQDEIPGMGGREQFTTQEEAMAFAVLAAYKLNIVNDFPSITTGDLCLLGKYVCEQG